ncbi:hypothetical protein Psuf_041920 [Phytohabitans suffuscus]|uniref:Uncharacterized protein n=1 Tax=Phytohabitans suffuscus TaxID=624315 RepID=A0A6F8YLI2_9ACTN|nr:hypothetical protein Psuf_041920 [Phytohabitans suffuscus]
MTPISTPRFSKQNTCSTPSSVDSASVRSICASSTVRARDGGSVANEALWSEVKHTTSQRPWAGRATTPSGSVTGRSLKEGNRFSKTTTS